MRRQNLLMESDKSCRVSVPLLSLKSCLRSSYSPCREPGANPILTAFPEVKTLVPGAGLATPSEAPCETFVGSSRFRFSIADMRRVLVKGDQGCRMNFLHQNSISDILIPRMDAESPQKLAA